MIGRMFGAVLVALLAGCGSGDGHSSAPDASNTPTPAVATATPTPMPATPVETPSAASARAFAIGAKSTLDVAGRPEQVVLRSDDAGASWMIVGSVDAIVHAVDFVDRDTGWVVGELTIFRSTDGGRSWEPLFSNTSTFRDVMFFAPTRGAVVGRSVDFVGAAQMLATTDGVSWTFAREQRTSPLFERGTLHFTCFTSVGVGIAIGSVDPLASVAAVALGSDGGESVVEISELVGHAPVVTGACSGERELWVGGRDNTLLHSSDGGGSWLDRSDTIRTLLGGDVAALAFVDPATGWLAGTRARRTIVLHTIDGGLTWSRQSLPEIGRARPLTLDFRPSGAGALLLEATADDGTRSPLVLATRDGGATWQRGDLPALESVVDLSLVD